MTEPSDLHESNMSGGNSRGRIVIMNRLSQRSSLSVSCMRNSEMSCMQGDGTQVRRMGGCREASHPCLSPDVCSLSLAKTKCLQPSALRNTGVHITSLPAQNVLLGFVEFQMWLEMRRKRGELRDPSESGAPHGFGETYRSTRNTIARCTSGAGIDSSEGFSKSKVDGADGLLNSIRYRVAGQE